MVYRTTPASSSETSELEKSGVGFATTENHPWSLQPHSRETAICVLHCGVDLSLGTRASIPFLLLYSFSNSCCIITQIVRQYSINFNISAAIFFGLTLLSSTWFRFVFFRAAEHRMVWILRHLGEVSECCNTVSHKELDNVGVGLTVLPPKPHFNG